METSFFPVCIYNNYVSLIWIWVIRICIQHSVLTSCKHLSIHQIIRPQMNPWRLFINIYTEGSLWVACGKCPSHYRLVRLRLTLCASMASKSFNAVRHFMHFIEWNCSISIQIHMKCVFKFPTEVITISADGVVPMRCQCPHYGNKWWQMSSRTLICVSRPQQINSIRQIGKEK